MIYLKLTFFSLEDNISVTLNMSCFWSLSSYYYWPQCQQGDARSLYERLEQTILFVRLTEEWKMKLIGFGCVGTSVNEHIWSWDQNIPNMTWAGTCTALSDTLFKIVKTRCCFKFISFMKKSPKKCLRLLSRKLCVALHWYNLSGVSRIWGRGVLIMQYAHAQNLSHTQ